MDFPLADISTLSKIELLELHRSVLEQALLFEEKLCKMNSGAQLMAQWRDDAQMDSFIWEAGKERKKRLAAIAADKLSEPVAVRDFKQMDALTFQRQNLDFIVSTFCHSVTFS